MKRIIFVFCVLMQIVFCQIGHCASDGWSYSTFHSDTYGDIGLWTKQNGFLFDFYMEIPDEQIPASSPLGQLNTPGNSVSYSAGTSGTLNIHF